MCQVVKYISVGTHFQFQKIIKNKKRDLDELWINVL